MPRHPPCTLYSLISFMWVIIKRNWFLFLPIYGKTLKSHFSLLIIVSHYSIFKLQNFKFEVRSSKFEVIVNFHTVIIFFHFAFLISHFAFKVVGLSGLEPPTSRLSGVRSNRLSYKPIWLWCISSHSHCGGDEEDRTPDLLLARQALSQLSYTPIFGIFIYSRY